MRRLVWLALLMGLCASAVAKTHIVAPMPPEVMAGKTIAIVNEVGVQQITDESYEALTEWGHFKVVNDPLKADVVLFFTSTSVPALFSTPDNPIRQYILIMTVMIPNQELPVFTDQEKLAIYRKNASYRCIDAFRKRIDAQ